MSRVRGFFKVRPGEERAAVLLVGLMLVSAAGGAVGGSAIEALFFERFGVDRLPTMYIILGLFSFAATLGISAVMSRVERKRLYAAAPLIMAALLAAGRLGSALNLGWFYAVLWLVMNVIKIMQSLVIWGLASAACDTRQARRLFPLFGAGGILGTVTGGLITPPLATWLHSENLLLVWGLALLATYAGGRAILARAPAEARRSAGEQAGIAGAMLSGFRATWGTPILRWISYAAVLFSVCFFSLALPFSRGAAAQYPDADQLAGFLGLFNSACTAAALLASLLLANRLFARFGVMPMLLVFPLIYLSGFAGLAAAATLLGSAPFALLVGTRFVKLAYMNGIAETAWHTVFNVVPPAQRDQVRAFVNGAPSQAGTFLAGLILFAGEQALQPEQLYGIGFAAAALLAYVTWRAGRAYAQALVEALRAGQPQVFFHEEEPFGGAGPDAEAVAVALGGLSDPDPGVRRVAAEIAGHIHDPRAAPALTAVLSDGDPAVRAAALRGLAKAGAAPALLDIAACLEDPEPEVRCQAVTTLEVLAGSPRGMAARIEPLLADPDPLVRVEAALSLLRHQPHGRAIQTLRGMALEADPQARARALEALGAAGGAAECERIVPALADSHPAVRAAAARALARADPAHAPEMLIPHLADHDSLVRRALGEALGSCGEPALEGLLPTLEDPRREDGALLALACLPAQKVEGQIRAYASRSAEAALRYHSLALGAARRYHANGAPGGIGALLARSLRQEADRRGLNALRALGLVSARETFAAAVENLVTENPAQRANALEALDSAGERETVRPLLVLWESGETLAPPLPDDRLLDLLDDPSAWLRACAALAAGGTREARITEKLQEMRAGDPDEMVREAVEKALEGEHKMETMATLSLMERILFLQRVPLFAGLPPGDLKQIAAITREVLFHDGQVIAPQGEVGMDMYIVVAGEVRVLVENGGAHEQRELVIRRAGEPVGEMSLIDREPRMASLVARGAVRALCLNQELFAEILRERPEISLAMLRTLSRRVREAGERVNGA